MTSEKPEISKHAATRRKRRRALHPNGTLPRPTLERLSEYLVILDECHNTGKKTISSTEIAELYGNTPSQVRQDIFQLPGARRSGQGYNTRQLAVAIRSALGLDKPTKVAIVGCGRIGLGLACNLPFKEYGLELAALFDCRTNLPGVPEGLTIMPDSEIARIVKEQNIPVAMITVPGPAAQAVADELVKGGIKCILNYAHERLKVPDDVVVKYQQVICVMMQLAYRSHSTGKRYKRRSKTT